MPIFGLSNEHLFVIKDRYECRKKLGLPLDKKIILQVGRATQNRGFDWIIDIIDKKVLDDSYMFKFVGINKVDEYYLQLEQRNFQVVEYSSQNLLVDYYNAADVLIYLPHNPSDVNFGGTAYVPLEALACGTPVIATSLHHFPGNEIHRIARIPNKKSDIVPMIRELTNANISRNKCRDIVLKHFSWNESAKRHMQIYQENR